MVTDLYLKSHALMLQVFWDKKGPHIISRGLGKESQILIQLKTANDFWAPGTQIGLRLCALGFTHAIPVLY